MKSQGSDPIHCRAFICNYWYKHYCISITHSQSRIKIVTYGPGELNSLIKYKMSVLLMMKRKFKQWWWTIPQWVHFNRITTFLLEIIRGLLCFLLFWRRWDIIILFWWRYIFCIVLVIHILKKQFLFIYENKFSKSTLSIPIK